MTQHIETDDIVVGGAYPKGLVVKNNGSYNIRYTAGGEELPALRELYPNFQTIRRGMLGWVWTSYGDDATAQGWGINDVTYIWFNELGLNLGLGGELTYKLNVLGDYHVDNVKVVGRQQPAIAPVVEGGSVEETLALLITAVNALITSNATHGLNATAP